MLCNVTAVDKAKQDLQRPAAPATEELQSALSWDSNSDRLPVKISAAAPEQPRLAPFHLQTFTDVSLRAGVPLAFIKKRLRMEEETAGIRYGIVQGLILATISGSWG